MRRPRLTLPPEGRMRIISVIGSAVLVVLVATAVAVWLNSGPPARSPSASHEWDPYGLQTGAQSGSSATPGARASAAPATATPSASPVTVVSGSPVPGPSATYRTIALLGLGGFDTEVTVSNPTRVAWSVALTLPEERTVENRSTALVSMKQQGTSVTLTPVSAQAESVTFIVRFPALLALGKSVTGCTVDGRACTAS